jgi:dTDP-4-amino-4,6-dideoxygalactose transaminase
MIRSSVLPFARPDITSEEKEAVLRVLDSGWLTQGKETDLFEEEFARITGAASAVAVNSATAALHLGLVAMGLKKGEAVLVPALTFTATAEVVHRCGGLPLLVDVDPHSYLITVETIERFLDSECHRDERGCIHSASGARIRGVICMHYGGRSCDLDALKKLCRREGWFLGEDAAHAFGTLYRGMPIGQHGDFCAFSFYATKNMTTGEGGMLTTPHDTVAHRCRRLRLHGIETPAHQRKNYYYDVVDEGFKYNLSDILAAMGRVQLRRHDSMMMRRRRIHETYSAHFAELEGIRPCPEAGGSSHHLYTIEIDPQLCMRDDFAAAIESHNVKTGLHFIPLYRMSHYRLRYGREEAGREEESWKRRYPGCEHIFQRILSLPIYSSMSDEDILDVVKAVKGAHAMMQEGLLQKNRS